MNVRSRLNISAFILGLTSMIGQIIIIRELIVVFYGNELSLGLILASWLFWVSIGSSLFGRLVDKLKSGEKLLSYVQLATALALPLTIFLIRNITSFLNIPTGRIVGVLPMLGSSFISLSAVCMLLGFSFTLISKIASSGSEGPSRAVGRIYLLEGLGASIGGLVYSFFLIKALTPFQNGFLVGGTNLIASLLLNKTIIQLLFVGGFSLTFILDWPGYLERYTRKLQFKPFEVKESADSIYGNITVTRIDSEYSFYENGLLIFTSGDRLTSEEAVHYPLLEHPSPENILLIGGGVGGPLKEILKHPVKNIDYVEMDPLIIKLAGKYLSITKDPRVNIIHTDGRLFVKRAPPGYDVIILNLPDPYTAMLNRFYSLEFFREVKNILNQGGIFSFRLSSSENYLNPEQAYYLAGIYNTLKKEFKDIKVFPGDSATFIASSAPNSLTYDTGILIDRLIKRSIDTQFVREYYLPFKLSPLRIKYMEDSLKESRSAKINRDFKPIGYLYHLTLWMSLFHAGKGLIPYINKIDLNSFILPLAIISIILFLIIRIRKLSFKVPVALSIMTTGMSEISFQIIVILAFQFLYGYLYYKIGLILTSFMIGLVLGTLCINRLLGSIKNERALYLKTQISICLYPLLLPLIFKYIARINLIRPDLGNGLQFSFTFLPIIAGFIGGFQFPLANKICLKGSGDVGKTTGLLYGIDLLGACIGGLLVGLLLVPILGIIQTCLFLSILNALVLILLNFTKRQ